MGKLIISIYDEIEWNREALHIELNRPIPSWDFRYFSKPNEPSEFERRYSTDLGIKKFDGFIRMIRW